MTDQTTIGGVNRDALLRLWFLFYVWAFVGGLFRAPPPWLWSAWFFGAGLTCLLLYRRSTLAGIVGFLVGGTAAAATLPDAYSVWRAVLSGHAFNGPAVGMLHDRPSLLFFHTARAFVPAVVLLVHVASRHRVLRAFEASLATRRNGRVIPPSAIYLVMPR